MPWYPIVMPARFRIDDLQDTDRDVFERTTWGALNPPKPLFWSERSARRKRTGEPLSRSTVLFVLAAAVCAGLAAALV